MNHNTWVLDESAPFFQSFPDNISEVESINEINFSLNSSNNDQNIFSQMIPNQTNYQIVIQKTQQKGEEQTPKTPRKLKKQINEQRKKFSHPDFKKNICGYQLKSAIRYFTGPDYAQQLASECESQCLLTSYEKVRKFYASKLDKVTGPSHLEMLIRPKNAEEEEIMQIFLRFLKWFLNERYVRYVMMEGRMQHKRQYINYKNNQLIPMISKMQESLSKPMDVQSTLHISQKSISLL